MDSFRFRDHVHTVTAAVDGYLAICHYRLGHQAEARAALRRATDRMETNVPSKLGGYLRGTVENWLICHIARREAEQMLGDPPRAE